MLLKYFLRRLTLESRHRPTTLPIGSSKVWTSIICLHELGSPHSAYQVIDALMLRRLMIS